LSPNLLLWCTSSTRRRYADLEARGFHGPAFQTLDRIFRLNPKAAASAAAASASGAALGGGGGGEGCELLAALRLPPESDRFHIHPAVLDGVFQLVGFIGAQSSTSGRGGGGGGDDRAWVPMGIGSVQLFKAGSSKEHSSSNLLRRSDFSFSSFDRLDHGSRGSSWGDLAGFGPTLSSVNLAGAGRLAPAASSSSSSLSSSPALLSSPSPLPGSVSGLSALKLSSSRLSAFGSSGGLSAMVGGVGGGEHRQRSRTGSGSGGSAGGAVGSDGEQLLWCHARLVSASARLRVLDFSVYDPTSRAVTLSLTDFKFAPLKAQPPPSALFEARWPEVPLARQPNASASGTTFPASFAAEPPSTGGSAGGAPAGFGAAESASAAASLGGSAGALEVAVLALPGLLEGFTAFSSATSLNGGGGGGGTSSGHALGRGLGPSAVASKLAAAGMRVTLVNAAASASLGSGRLGGGGESSGGLSRSASGSGPLAGIEGPAAAAELSTSVPRATEVSATATAVVVPVGRVAGPSGLAAALAALLRFTQALWRQERGSAAGAVAKVVVLTSGADGPQATELEAAAKESCVRNHNTLEKK